MYYCWGTSERIETGRKALLSKDELIVMRDKIRKASKRASETREQALHRQEQNRTHLACARVLHFSAVHYTLQFMV